MNNNLNNSTKTNVDAIMGDYINKLNSLAHNFNKVPDHILNMLNEDDVYLYYDLEDDGYLFLDKNKNIRGISRDGELIASAPDNDIYMDILGLDRVYIDAYKIYYIEGGWGL